MTLLKENMVVFGKQMRQATERWGLGLPIHIEMLLNSINIDYDNLLVLNRAYIEYHIALSIGPFVENCYCLPIDHPRSLQA